MSLLNFPDPIAWYEGARTAGLERDEINAFVSMLYSAQISFLWRSGSSRWALWTGEGKALQDAATSAYLTLSRLESRKFLTLTIPSDMLEASNLSRFQTEQKT